MILLDFAAVFQKVDNSARHTSFLRGRTLPPPASHPLPPPPGPGAARPSGACLASLGASHPSRTQTTDHGPRTLAAASAPWPLPRPAPRLSPQLSTCTAAGPRTQETSRFPPSQEWEWGQDTPHMPPAAYRLRPPEPHRRPQHSTCRVEARRAPRAGRGASFSGRRCGARNTPGRWRGRRTRGRHGGIWGVGRGGHGRGRREAGEGDSLSATL